jgi:hypothetical protein
LLEANPQVLAPEGTENSVVEKKALQNAIVKIQSFKSTAK